MSKTNELRKLIVESLKPICDKVFYENADDENMYPHVVYSFNPVDLGDLFRDDLILNIDVWDKAESASRVEDICDSIESIFNAENLPQEKILPTFFRISRTPVKDEDKTIRHRLLRFQIQNYER